MPPPPVTPSPHRFVVKKQPHVRRTPLATEQPSHPSTQQFNATPRFKPTGTPIFAASTPSAAHFLTPGRQLEKQEDIIDQPSESSQDVHHSIEIDDHDIDLGYLSTDTDPDFMIEERNPKRRRFSSSPTLKNDYQAPEEQDNCDDAHNSSPPADVASPPASRRLVSTAPRFLTSTPSIPQQNQSTFIKPPRFRPPDPPPQGQSSDPLPDQFSPHRRGQKYVPGGLAAEVRDWLINIESSISSNSTRKDDSPWLLKLMADEISGGGRAGFTLVRGRQVLNGDIDTMIDPLGVINIILAGEGTSTGLQKGSKAEVGKAVGIKSPVWEVVIEGEKWVVGVDWTVLGGLDS